MQIRRRPTYGPFAVVTGASDGIGAAFAHELARRGYHLVLAARRLDRLEALATGLRAAHGVQVEPIEVDLSQPDGVDRLIAAAADHNVGLLVAAAGFGTSGPFNAQSVASELEMVDVNCRAVLALTHAFAGRFLARGRGGIVLFGSLVGFQGVPRAAAYAATKAFIQTFAEGLRPEMKPHGVDVVCVAPGPVASGFAARANMVMGIAAKPEQVPREALDALGRRTTVRPGWLSKALEALFFSLPRRARTLIMTQVMKGMTQAANVARR